jgi:hypothetical protein
MRRSLAVALALAVTAGSACWTALALTGPAAAVPHRTVVASDRTTAAISPRSSGPLLTVTTPRVASAHLGPTRHAAQSSRRSRRERPAARSTRVAGRKHGRLGAGLIEQVASPGSPAQLLIALVVCCAVGTAFVVSLGRRRETVPVKVRRR